MLRNFRQVFKGQQKYMTLVMGAVLLSLVAYLAPSSGAANAPDNVMARVYGHEITYRDLYLRMNEMMEQYGKQASSESLRPFVQGQALNQLIQAKLVEEMAERRGLMATDVEVRDRLEAMFKATPGFTKPDGSLKSVEEISELLAENPRRPLTLKMLEDDTRKSLIREKMLAEAAGRTPVDEAWLNQEFRVKHEKVSLDVVTLMPELSQIADPGDAKLGEWMKAQGARFQVGPRRVVSFVALDQAGFGKTLDPSDAELKSTYDGKKSQYTELRSAHILLKGADEKELAQATQTLKDVRAKVLQGADFLKLAESMSQDPSAKTNKGDLGFMKHGALVKPFEDAAMALKVGEVSQPVRTSFGVHLIKLLDRKERTFDEVKEELRTQMVQERFTAKAKEKLEQLRKTTGDKGDLTRAAKAQNLTVQVSKPFLDEPSTAIEGLPGAGMVVSEAFRLKVGQVSKVQRVADKYVVFRVQEEKPTAIPALADIRGKVLDAFRLEEARKALATRIQAALAKDDLSTLGATTAQDDKVIREVGEAAQHPGLVKALLETPAGKCTPLIWTANGQAWVARVKSRTAAGAMTFEQRRTLVKELQDGLGMKTLTAELQELYTKGKMRSGLSSLWGRFGGIYTNEEALKLVRGSDAE